MSIEFIFKDKAIVNKIEDYKLDKKFIEIPTNPNINTTKLIEHENL